MPFKPETQVWPEDRAILFVHGIGNAKKGDGHVLIDMLKGGLDDQAGKFAYYSLYYDDINDWFKEKIKFTDAIKALKNAIKPGIGDDSVSDTIAEYSGDIIWPVLNSAAYDAIQTAYITQLQQIVLDGQKRSVKATNQKISIICHSLGCFHTYEMLHKVADEPLHNLSPDKLCFANVIFMASPVQLIKTVAQKIGHLVPGNLAVLKPGGLRCPSRKVVFWNYSSTKNLVSITGDYDPVGGYLLKKRLDWAYMDVPGQVSKIDPQDLLKINNKTELAAILSQSFSTDGPPKITVNNPHSWESYVKNHQEEIKEWLTA